MANINKNIIMQAGAAVANATNKAAGLSASTPEPGSIISVIQLVNGGRTIGPDALAHFTESVRNKLLSLLVSMEPIQDFNGYDHPWPGGGGANICNPNGFNEYSAESWEATSTLETISVTHKSVYTQTPPYIALPVVSGKTYKITFDSISPSNGNYVYLYFNGSNRALISNGYTFTAASYTDYRINFAAAIPSGTTITITKLMVAESTVNIWQPYANICPITGRTGLNVYAGPTSAIGDATTYSMDWTSPAGTVYAGSADIVSGDIKAAPYYASYNGETLVGPWVSSMDVYDPEGTPTTGAQVVDLGGAMTEYHITGQDIITLVGDNYIWSDSGDVTITE